MREGQYGGGDVVDERLMNKVKKYVNKDKLGPFATDLDVDESVYINETSRKKKIFKVRAFNSS